MQDRKQHPSLWIFDGSIILSVPSAAKGHDVLFKVHKSTLSRESIIFSDMFTLPDPDIPISSSNAAETYESLPLVALSDEAEDWEKLLNILYNPMDFNPKKYDPELPLFFDGILRLATKYQMDAIRRRLVAHIENDWPRSLAEWDAFQQRICNIESRLQCDGDSPMETRPKFDALLPEPAAAIYLARQHNIPNLLPSALYYLRVLKTAMDINTTSFLNSEFKLSTASVRWGLVTTEDRLRVETGLTKMCREVHSVCRSSIELDDWSNGFTESEQDLKFFKFKDCGSPGLCSSALRMFMSEVVHTVNFSRDPFTELNLRIGKEYRKQPGMCTTCNSNISPQLILIELRRNLWDKMPELFGLAAPEQQESYPISHLH